MGDKEKIIWITGASSGIGKSTAFQFVKGGNIVAASSRNGNQLGRIKADLAGDEKLFEIFPMDISQNEDVENTSRLISKKYRIQCLINNAGITSFSQAIDDNPEKIKKIIE